MPTNCLSVFDHFVGLALKGLNLLYNKSTRKTDIPAKVLKESINVSSKELTTVINSCLEKGPFPDELKIADVSSIFKKDEDLNKENYRPVTILSYMSKSFRKAPL